MDVWKRAIIKTIDACNGDAHYEVICKNIDTFIELREKDYKEIQPGLPAYWGQIKLHIKWLLKFEDIVERLPKVYALTDQGKKRVLEKNYSWEGCYDEKTKKRTKEAEWI